MASTVEVNFIPISFWDASYLYDTATLQLMSAMCLTRGKNEFMWADSGNQLRLYPRLVFENLLLALSQYAANPTGYPAPLLVATS